jgi:quinol monooxygenase YgiN
VTPATDGANTWETTMQRAVRYLVLVLTACLFAWPATAEERGPITVVTHIDVIPDFLNQALPVLKKFAADSKADPGVVAFDLITWAPTTNHFQLIETYQSLDAFNQHVQSAHTVAFRSTVQPFIGAPYDERLYVGSGHENVANR